MGVIKKYSEDGYLETEIFKKEDGTLDYIKYYNCNEDHYMTRFYRKNGSISIVKKIKDDSIEYFDEKEICYKIEYYKNDVLKYVNYYWANFELDRKICFRINGNLKSIEYFDAHEDVYLIEYFNENGDLHHKKIID